MIARLIIAAIVTGVCVPALASERQLPKLKLDMPQQPAPAYRDLPGVKTPEQLEASRSDGFTCTTVLRTYRNNDPDAGFSRSLPQSVYRCEKDGMAVESRNPPSRGAWMPGINPSDAR